MALETVIKTVRMPLKLEAELQEKAQENLRSFTQEVILRLTRSVEQERAVVRRD